MNATLKGDFWEVKNSTPWLRLKLSVKLPHGLEELINAVKKIIEENTIDSEKRENSTMSVEKEPDKVFIKYYSVQIELGRIENTARWHQFC